MVRLLIYALPLILMIYALADCIQDQDVARTNVAKPLWYVVIIVLPVFGPVGWLVVSRMTRAENDSAPTPPIWPAPDASRQPRRPMAPDDDPEFLARLAREQRERQKRSASDTDTDPGGKPAPPAKPEKNGESPRRYNSDTES